MQLPKRMSGILTTVGCTLIANQDISYILTVHPDLHREGVLDSAQTSCLWETHTIEYPFVLLYYSWLEYG
jgi:hypothetical protein